MSFLSGSEGSSIKGTTHYITLKAQLSWKDKNGKEMYLLNPIYDYKTNIIYSNLEEARSKYTNPDPHWYKDNDKHLVNAVWDKKFKLGMPYNQPKSRIRENLNDIFIYLQELNEYRSSGQIKPVREKQWTNKETLEKKIVFLKHFNMRIEKWEREELQKS
jgi:hypothetical protein